MPVYSQFKYMFLHAKPNKFILLRARPRQSHTFCMALGEGVNTFPVWLILANEIVACNYYD